MSPIYPKLPFEKRVKNKPAPYWQGSVRPFGPEMPKKILKVSPRPSGSGILKSLQKVLGTVWEVSGGYMESVGRDRKPETHFWLFWGGQHLSETPPETLFDFLSRWLLCLTGGITSWGLIIYHANFSSDISSSKYKCVNVSPRINSKNAWFPQKFQGASISFIKC